ncbi:MAG TPA: pyridoxal-phosphate dependent enzyme, partial [Nitrososphaeraceae archaeon]|nr:pyridoxal-phosphate dependent enzyme [Nitrososphaeraceae archaeon]
MKGVNISSSRHPTIEDISTARSSLDTSIRKTPLHKSDTFSRMVGTDTFLKLECLQKTGSFKVRGAFTKLNSLSSKERSNGVIAASAGN